MKKFKKYKSSADESSAWKNHYDFVGPLVFTKKMVHLFTPLPFTLYGQNNMYTVWVLEVGQRLKNINIHYIFGSPDWKSNKWRQAIIQYYLCKTLRFPVPYIQETNQLCTAKWIWHSSIFSSIKPKHDKQLFVYFCVFPRFYLDLPILCRKLFWTSNQNNFGSKQVNSGKNGEKHKSKQTISCHVLA